MLSLKEANEIRMKTIGTLCFIGWVCMFLAGCGQSSKMSSSDLPGTYIAKFSHGYETLVLNSDASYEQRYSSYASTVVLTNDGKWEFYTNPHPFVSLNHALLFDNKSNQPQIPPTRCDLGLNILIWRGGRIELVISEDEGLGYRKQPQKNVNQR